MSYKVFYTDTVSTQYIFHYPFIVIKQKLLYLCFSLSLEHKTLFDKVWSCSQMLLCRWCLMAMACLTIHTPVVWMFSACRHPQCSRKKWWDRCLHFNFHSTWVPWKKQRQTQTIKKKCLKEKKSKTVGTKTKDKNETGKKLHYSFKKLQNFEVGENIQCLRNDKNKLVLHWLSLPLCRTIFGSWIIKLVLQHSEANSNKQSFHFNNVPFSSKHAVILFNVAIISYLHGEDLAIWLILTCLHQNKVQICIFSSRVWTEKNWKDKVNEYKTEKHAVWNLRVICSEPNQDVRCNYAPRRSAKIVLSNFQPHRKLELFEIQYSILFYREQKHSLRRIISNKMEIFCKDVFPRQPET